LAAAFRHSFVNPAFENNIYITWPGSRSRVWGAYWHRMGVGRALVEVMVEAACGGVG